VTRPRLVALPGRGGARRADEPRELCVVLACHQLVCVLPARWIERLVMPDEVASIAPVSAEAHAPPLVLVGEKHFAAWNLGVLLGLAPLDAAWVLLRVPHKGATLPIALHTGACLVVQPLAPGVSFPAGAFRARPGAVVSALPTSAIKSRLAVDLALCLDPAHLWGEDELDLAARVLGAAGQV